MLFCCLHLLGWHFRVLSNYFCGRCCFFSLVELDSDIDSFSLLLWFLQEFAVSLRNSISSIREMPKIRNLTFVLDACKVLEQARKVRLDNTVLLRFRFNSADVRRHQPCSSPKKRRQRKLEGRSSIRTGEELMSALPCFESELNSVCSVPDSKVIGFGAQSLIHNWSLPLVEICCGLLVLYSTTPTSLWAPFSLFTATFVQPGLPSIAWSCVLMGLTFGCWSVTLVMHLQSVFL